MKAMVSFALVELWTDAGIDFECLLEEYMARECLMVMVSKT